MKNYIYWIRYDADDIRKLCRTQNFPFSFPQTSQPSSARDFVSSQDKILGARIPSCSAIEVVLFQERWVGEFTKFLRVTGDKEKSFITWLVSDCIMFTNCLCWPTTRPKVLRTIQKRSGSTYISMKENLCVTQYHSRDCNRWRPGHKIINSGSHHTLHFQGAALGSTTGIGNKFSHYWS
jgi:hypothetical protein